MSTSCPTYDAPTPPPNLTSWQRSRLLKSTRKLAKILGETPLYQIDTPSPSPNQSRGNTQPSSRRPIISITKNFARTALEPIQVALRREPDGGIEGAQSINSEHENTGPTLRRRDHSPASFFDLSNLMPDNSHACYTSHVSSSPIETSYRGRQLSIASISSPSLIRSPTECEVEEREARSRRKRLSKLTRYLGESIPPDLVISNVTNSKPKVCSAAPPLEQEKSFSSPTITTPISKPPNSAGAIPGKADSFVGSIGQSLSQRFNGVTSPRPLAQKLRSSRSESTLSVSHEHLTLLLPNKHFAADDRPDTPIDGECWASPQSEPPTSSLCSPTSGNLP